jgi:L-seryl-tRNA(Ser) seleniumtransferase
MNGVPQKEATLAARRAIAEAREAIAHGHKMPELDQIAARAQDLLADAEATTLRHAVNCTGVVLHTGLGRSVLPEQSARRLADAARHLTLEIEPNSGERGLRTRHVEQLICDLIGAEACTVANNCAGAVLLMLAALCRDKEVLISRGELVEIGGSFRMPDVMVQSGCVMREVGTTNKTHLADYAKAITPDTRAILRVHRSNFAIAGFTERPELRDLAELARRQGILILEDLGSGCLADLTRYGLPDEPRVQESLKAGADAVCFSCDKILGGPQCGIIAGKQELIQQIASHPLQRALRVDKLTLLALLETLRLWQDLPRAEQEIPTLRFITRNSDDVRKLAQRVIRATGKLPGAEMKILPGVSEIGGGALPGKTLPTWLISLKSSLSPQEVARKLRLSRPAIFGRVENGAFILDFRCVFEEEIPQVACALKAAFPDV